MAMKGVSLLTELLLLNEELSIGSKCIVVLTILFDKLLILDRKHSIRDKGSSDLKWIVGQLMGFVNNVRADAEGAESKDDDTRSKASTTTQTNTPDSILETDREMTKERGSHQRSERDDDHYPSTRNYRPEYRGSDPHSSRVNTNNRNDDSWNNDSFPR